MSRSSLFLFFSLAVFAVSVDCEADEGELKPDFYKKSCPQAEDIVRDITWNRTAANLALGAKLLRLHYHDCFVRGCDGSILLDATGSNSSEKQARPNLSLAGYDVIDEIKTAIEQECPGVVSCADIVALAARDAVSFQFQKPMWHVFTGRRDGLVSFASDVPGNLPSPNSNFTTLQQNFQKKGLNVRDLVTLSGAHTIGVAHCGTFARRLYNFTGAGDADPSLDPTYADVLRILCPNPPKPATTVEMDFLDSLAFNSHYYDIVTQHKGLFVSDAALLTDSKSAEMVNQLQKPQNFLEQFGLSMIRMGAVEVLTGENGEIRKQCHVINS